MSWRRPVSKSIAVTLSLQIWMRFFAFRGYPYRSTSGQRWFLLSKQRPSSCPQYRVIGAFLLFSDFFFGIFWGFSASALFLAIRSSRAASISSCVMHGGAVLETVYLNPVIVCTSLDMSMSFRDEAVRISAPVSLSHLG
jgi:hypothetical protein